MYEFGIVNTNYWLLKNYYLHNDFVFHPQNDIFEITGGYIQFLSLIYFCSYVSFLGRHYEKIGDNGPTSVIFLPFGHRFLEFNFSYYNFIF